MTRFIYALKEIRACLEGGDPDRRAAAAGLLAPRAPSPRDFPPASSADAKSDTDRGFSKSGHDPNNSRL